MFVCASISIIVVAGNPSAKGASRPKSFGKKGEGPSANRLFQGASSRGLKGGASSKATKVWDSPAGCYTARNARN